MLKSLLSFILLIMFVPVCRLPGHAFQKGGREPINPPPSGSSSGGKPVKRNSPRVPPKSPRELVKRKPVEARPRFAEILVNVSPADSTILLNGVEYRAENGMFKRAELKPGAYKVVVRKSGYREQVYDLSVAAGDSKPLNATLEPSLGIVNVAPVVANSVISIVDAETKHEVGRYDGRAHNVTLSPGRYQVVISKNGYRTTVRDVTVEDARTIDLEPALEPLPTQTAERSRPAKPSFRTDAATQIQAVPDGKYLVVYLNGRSGDAESTVGPVEVVLGGDYIRSGGEVTVKGMLTGFPCQVNFVKLENVAEFSFIEPPGISNQWGRVVVRVRPKDSKRAMHFLINWKRL